MKVQIQFYISVKYAYTVYILYVHMHICISPLNGSTYTWINQTTN